jgi:hypothetical protein
MKPVDTKIVLGHNKKKEHYRGISFMNIDAKMIKNIFNNNKILANLVTH